MKFKVHIKHDNNNTILSIPTDLIERIKLFKNINETVTEDSLADIIPLYNVSKEILDWILEILLLYPRGINVCKFDYSLIKDDINMKDLCEALDFLECDELMDVLLMHIAKNTSYEFITPSGL